MNMKSKIKTTHTKADELLWFFENTGKIYFTVGSPTNKCEYQFPLFLSKPQKNDCVKIIPAKGSIALSTEEVSIFLLENTLKVFNVLENSIDDISSDTFKLLYRYNQFLLHLLSVIYPNDIKTQSDYINNVEKCTKLKDVLQAKKLELTGASTRFLLKTYAPVEKTKELFNVFDDLIYEYINEEELSPRTVKFNSHTGKLQYKDASHQFQRGKDGSMNRLQFFKTLWDDRKVINKGLVDIGGKTHSMNYLASSIGFVLNPSDLKRGRRGDFKEMIRGIKRTLKEKKITPLKIDTTDETKIQLILTDG